MTTPIHDQPGLHAKKANLDQLVEQQIQAAYALIKSPAGSVTSDARIRLAISHLEAAVAYRQQQGRTV